MRKLRLNKISHRLTLLYALLFFMAIALVNLATLAGMRYYVDQTSMQQIYGVKQVIDTDIKTYSDIPNLDFKKLSDVASNVDVNIYEQGKLIYSTGEVYVFNTLPKSTSTGVQSLESGESRVLVLTSQHYLTSSEKVEIEIIKDMSDEDGFLHMLAGIILLIDLFVAIGAIAAGYLVSKKALSPIEKIREQAQAISVSELSSRIYVEGPDDELKRLADTFNEMIYRIQLAYEKQNRFTLDASHELATPLAVIKGYVDILDRWGKYEKDVLDESLAGIKNELVQMTALLDTLLLLSKADNEIYKLACSQFSLKNLYDEVIRESHLLESKHIIKGSCDNEISFYGDKLLLKQMLRALIDNSMKYSKEESIIEINFKKDSEVVTILVQDNGIGIEENEIPFIFDRFYRVDRSRTRQIKGTGLGLSMVKWIVESHKGTIEVKSKLGYGTLFIIRLPYIQSEDMSFS